MSSITADFEFEIGETVYCKCVDNSALRPRQYMVQERHAIECHGGVQLFYLLHCDGIYGVRYPELALTRDEPHVSLFGRRHRGD